LVDDDTNTKILNHACYVSGSWGVIGEKYLQSSMLVCVSIPVNVGTLVQLGLIDEFGENKTICKIVSQ